MKVMGQHFHIEWSTGQYRSTHYFALLHADDEARLASIDSDVLEAYLDEAPTDATTYAGAYWSKRHFGWAERATKGGADSHDDFTSEGKVAVTDTSDPYHLSAHPPSARTLARAHPTPTATSSRPMTWCCTSIARRTPPTTSRSRTPPSASRGCALSIAFATLFLGAAV